ncbi:DUF3071 domain-containing protein, partial [Mycobacteroides abscessus subsp. abscessus]|nr:DUF3071 domain-containing protein [Mycobacteroides abscessus subsp. abscessus]
ARELIDPTFTRSLRPVAAVSPLLPEPEPELFTESPAPLPEPEPAVAEEHTETETTQAPAPRRSRRSKPAVPTWEDVLLGVRSSGQN